MIKCKIYITNDNVYMDADVSIDIKLPCVPQIGSTLYLDEEQSLQLLNKAKSSLEIAERYAPKWFYGHSYNVEEVKEENLVDMGFDDATHVKAVSYNANSEIVEIGLDDFNILEDTKIEER